MKRLAGTSPAAMVFVPAAFLASSDCALGAAPLPSPALLLQAPRASSAATPTRSASAWLLMRNLLFMCEMKWPGAGWVPTAGPIVMQRLGQQRSDDRRDELGRRVDLVNVAVV